MFPCDDHQVPTEPVPDNNDPLPGEDPTPEEDPVPDHNPVADAAALTSQRRRQTRSTGAARRASLVPSLS
jgi:hypothetical protein